MKGQRALLASLAILLLAVGAQAQGATIDPWITGQTYPPVTVDCGESVTFSWPAGEFHGVASIPSGVCPANFANILETSQIGPHTVSIPMNTAGDFWFACPVGTHCASGGMLQQVTVGPCDTAPAPSVVAPAPSVIAPVPAVSGPVPALAPAPVLAPAPDTLPVAEPPSVPIANRPASAPAVAPAPANAAEATAAVLPGIAAVALGVALLAF